MPKQDGFHLVRGTLGNTTFFKTQDGYYARAKTSVNAEKVANDPRFRRTRENMAEFVRVAKAGALIRKNLTTVLKTTADKKLIRRMNPELMKVLRKDPVNRRGERTVQDGQLKLLKGFDFNAYSLLGAINKAPFTTNIDRSTGIATVDFASFNPADMIKSPAGSTHFKIVVAAGAFDFAGNEATVDIENTGLLPLDSSPTGAVSVSCNIPAGSNLPVLLICGIQFYEELNGVTDLLTGGAFNALQIVEVNTI